MTLSGAVPVYIYYLAQDDPRKNTAIRLERHGKARLLDDPRRVPDQAVLLNPFAKKALSREDLPAMRKRGLVAVDCSWASAEEAFSSLLGRTRSRALPFLLAANPVNWGKPSKLSTAEALGAALHIAGETRQAADLLSALPFGQPFLDLNKEPLADYQAAATSSEVVAAQWSYIDQPEQSPKAKRTASGRKRRGSEEE